MALERGAVATPPVTASSKCIPVPAAASRPPGPGARRRDRRCIKLDSNHHQLENNFSAKRIDPGRHVRLSVHLTIVYNLLDRPEEAVKELEPSWYGI